MTPKNGVDGKHFKVFVFKKGFECEAVECPRGDCIRSISIFRHDYYSNMVRICGDDHKVLVWYSPKNDSYLVSST